MKILHVIPNLIKGGAQRLVIDICNEFKNYNNFEVKIIVLSNSKNFFSFISKNLDIQYCEVKVELSVLKKDTIKIQSYEKILDEFNPEIIHSHLYFSELVTHQSTRKNIKYITHFHDNIQQFSEIKVANFFLKEKITNFYEKTRLFNKYKKANKTFITISNDCNDYAKSVVPKKFLNKIVKLHNAINHNHFALNQKVHNKLNKINLVNVGNLIEKKNQIFLVDVVKCLVLKKYKVSLKIIGEGVFRDKIANKIRNLKLENEITLLGSVDNVQDYLWDSNCYIHSAFYEPFGLVLIEAMAAKIPVISYNGRGNKDIIKNNKTGFLINELDPEKFADAVIKLFEDKKLYNEIVEKAFNFSKKFDIKNYVSELIKIYKK